MSPNLQVRRFVHADKPELKLWIFLLLHIFEMFLNRTPNAKKNTKTICLHASFTESQADNRALSVKYGMYKSSNVSGVTLGVYFA